tara:strand:- start:1052 stop:2179 length:1128 start_codon:yes stop_codon:yes gene_type:complete
MPFKENDRPRKEDRVFKTGVGHCKDAVITLRLRNSRNNDVSPLNIKIKLDDNDAVQLWYQRFKHELKSNAFLRKEHVFMGESTLDTEEMIEKVNSTLDHISKFDFVAEQWSRWQDFVKADQTNVINQPLTKNPEISERLSIEDFADGNDNERMNVVHNYFPLLSGPADKTTAHLYVAPPDVQASICRLNLEVHELHTTLQNDEQADFNMHVNVSWQRAPKKLPVLPESFDDLFTKYTKFGDVLLGYPQIGKTHIEAYAEEDEELEDEHVEPIKYLSGDMLIKFSTDQHENWVEGFDNWLIEQGLDPEDKTGRYGYAKLGTVVDVDLDFVQEEISGKYDDIDRIIVVDKEEHLDHEFPYSRHDDDYETKFLRYLHD